MKNSENLYVSFNFLAYQMNWTRFMGILFYFLKRIHFILMDTSITSALDLSTFSEKLFSSSHPASIFQPYRQKLTMQSALKIKVAPSDLARISRRAKQPRGIYTRRIPSASASLSWRRTYFRGARALYLSSRPLAERFTRLELAVCS